MAKTQTSLTTNSISTTDALILDTLSYEPKLSTGEKVAIGFGIAGGAIVIGYFVYKGISYLVVKHKEKKGKENYTYIPVDNASIPQAVPQVNPESYPANLPYTPEQQPQQGQQNPQPQPQQQAAVNPEQFVTREEFNQMANAVNAIGQNVITVANNVTIMSQNMDSKFNEVADTVTKLTGIVDSMGNAIKERNNQEFINMQNAVNVSQQQAAEANVARERAESEANHLMGMHDQIASQIGAPMYNQIPRANFQRVPIVDPSTPYPNLSQP